MQFIDIGTKDSLYPKFLDKIDCFDFIHLFEPNSIFAEKLRNKYSNYQNIKIHEIAVSNQNGTADFYIAKLNAASSLLKPSETIQKQFNLKSYNTKNIITVQTFTLDYLAKNNYISNIPTLIKIDAQGMEYEIIHASKNFFINNVELIIVEADFHKRYENGSNFNQVDSILNSIGFEFVKFIDEIYLREDPATKFYADAIYTKSQSTLSTKFKSFLHLF